MVVKDYYAELPIAIKVSGRYHDIGAFAADVANLSRIVTLHNMNIASTRTRAACSMEATARTYRYLGPERGAGGAEEGAARRERRNERLKDLRTQQRGPGDRAARRLQRRTG